MPSTPSVISRVSCHRLTGTSGDSDTPSRHASTIGTRSSISSGPGRERRRPALRRDGGIANPTGSSSSGETAMLSTASLLSLTSPQVVDDVAADPALEQTGTTQRMRPAAPRRHPDPIPHRSAAYQGPRDDQCHNPDEQVLGCPVDGLLRGGSRSGGRLRRVADSASRRADSRRRPQLRIFATTSPGPDIGDRARHRTSVNQR